MKRFRAMLVAVATSTLLITCDDSDEREPDLPLEETLTRHSDWVHSSDPFMNTRRRGRFDWYSHRDRVLLSELDSAAVQNPEDEVEFRLLECVFFPYATIGLEPEPVAVDETSYGSMTQKVGLDTTVTALEFLMYVHGNSGSGWLYLDFGVFSEDVLQNGILDTEDLNGDGWNVTANEDVGLDRMRGQDVPWPIPIELAEWEGSDSAMVDHFGQFHDYQDLDFNGTRTVDEPWSTDDFIRAPRGPYDYYEQIPFNSHGWERNSEDSDQIYPDTEDLNGNHRLDLYNGYYRYRILLDPDDMSHPPTIMQFNGSGWWRVRINFYDRNRVLVGIPDPFQPSSLRMSLTGFSAPIALTLCAFRFY